MWRLFMLFLVPASALAEVSDKAPSIEQLLLSGVIIAIAAVTAILWRLWAGAVATLFALILASMNYDLLLDRHIGPALVLEQGSIYAWAAYGSATVIYVSLGAAWAYKYYRRRSAD